MALLAGGPLISGLLRRPPPPLPVLDQLPPTGRGRLVVFADPACPECLSASADALHALSRRLRLVRPGFDLEWVALGDAPDFPRGPGVIVPEPGRSTPLLALLARRPEKSELRRGERALLIDPRGRLRALPELAAAPERELLPAITQVVNGR